MRHDIEAAKSGRANEPLPRAVAEALRAGLGRYAQARSSSARTASSR
jgi:hypothetical protein